ncbi:MAG: Na+/H+ antiporter subunit E [Planctomycetota bacterium]|nr:Na+/H+ antiporter subunit E [Planctomycetota bacterium]
MRFLVTWILLAALWIGLSGHTDVVHLTFGFLSVTLVSLISHRHLMGDGSLSTLSGRLLRLALYTPWLLWEIVLANLDVMLRVFGVRSIDPRVIRFRPELQDDFGKTVLANSITLTPGTVTVDIEPDGTYVIHALSREAAEGVLAGRMEGKVRGVEGGS